VRGTRGETGNSFALVAPAINDRSRASSSCLRSSRRLAMRSAAASIDWRSSNGGEKVALRAGLSARCARRYSSNVSPLASSKSSSSANAIARDLELHVHTHVSAWRETREFKFKFKLGCLLFMK